jgi:hypothetical protein
MTFTVVDGAGTLKVGEVLEAHLAPFQGATGKPTTMSETVFSTIPGSPAFPGKASVFRRDSSKLGRPDLDISGKNAVQGMFAFNG